MKKYCVIILCAAMIFSLIACNSTASNIQSTEESCKQPTVDTFLPEAKNMAAVSVPTVTHEVTADDGTVLFRYTYQNIHLVLPEQEIADAVILDFLNRIDSTQEHADSLMAQAEIAYAPSGNFLPYEYKLVYSPTRIDTGVLSFFGTTTVYSGGAHPTYDCAAANYDLLNGNVLTLGSILTHQDKLTQLETLLLAELKTMEQEKYLRQDYDQIVSHRFDGEESYDEDWYFTSTGLCFYFPPYEIAPYSSGIITAEIPYEKLIGIIDNAYFPPERIQTYSDVAAAHLDQNVLKERTQIAELPLTQNGEKFLLHTDGMIEDLKVIKTDPATMDSTTLFLSQYLTPWDGVVLTLPQAELATLHITYRSGNNSVTRPLPALVKATA